MAKKSTKLEALWLEVVETKPDSKLVNDMLEWIRNKVADTVFKGTLEIGMHILDHFFEGDLSLARSTSPSKRESFRSLAEQCAKDPTIRMSKSALQRAVGIAVIVKQLPLKANYRLLAPTHQAALLPMRVPAEIERLSKLVLSNDLSVSEVSDLVREKKPVPDGERRGRPTKSIVVKMLNRSLRAFTLDGGKKSFTAAQIKALDADDVKEALKSAEGLVERLNRLIEKLHHAEGG